MRMFPEGFIWYDDRGTSSFIEHSDQMAILDLSDLCELMSLHTSNPTLTIVDQVIVLGALVGSH